MLTVESFGVAFGSRAVLGDVSFSLKEGMNVLVGPAGSGKTTLLRTLAGLDQFQPLMTTWGSLNVADQARPSAARPLLVLQKERLLPVSLFDSLSGAHPTPAGVPPAEQKQRFAEALRQLRLDSFAQRLDENTHALSDAEKKLFLVFRGSLGSSPILMADEPMAGLNDDEAAPIVELLRSEAERRTVLVVTHNQTRARALGGHTVFLAGGTVQSYSKTTDFFDPNKASGLDAQFIQTGRVSLPSINSDPATLNDDSPAPLTVEVPDHGRGPRTFHWLVPEKIGGCPRPGVVASFDDDIRDLKDLGVTVLVNLEETLIYSAEAASEQGLTVIHEPVTDMSVPNMEQAQRLCRQLDRSIEAGESVVVHCRAGQGRTGLVLAMHLIAQGDSAAAAFRQVQAINPKWVQSDEQLEFLPEFSGFLATHGLGGPRHEIISSAERCLR